MDLLRHVLSLGPGDFGTLSGWPLKMAIKLPKLLLLAFLAIFHHFEGQKVPEILFLFWGAFILGDFLFWGLLILGTFYFGGLFIFGHFRL